MELGLLWDDATRPVLGRAFPMGNPFYSDVGQAAIAASASVSDAREQLEDDADYASSSAKLETEYEDEDFMMNWRMRTDKFQSQLLRGSRDLTITIGPSSSQKKRGAGGRRNSAAVQQNHTSTMRHGFVGAEVVHHLNGLVPVHRAVQRHAVELIAAAEMPWRTGPEGPMTPPSCYAVIHWNDMTVGQSEVIERERNPHWRQAFELIDVRADDCNELRIEIFAMPTSGATTVGDAENIVSMTSPRGKLGGKKWLGQAVWRGGKGEYPGDAVLTLAMKTKPPQADDIDPDALTMTVEAVARERVCL
jgi:hypothetical protein